MCLPLPWKPRYSEAEARAAIRGADTWADVLSALGYAYFGKNIQTVRKWARRWGIPIDHLPNGRSGLRHRYTRREAEVAVATSRSWAETLRKLGYCHTGANPKTLKKRGAEWRISTAHFDPYAASNEALRRQAKPLDEILVEGSTYSRSALKRRLYEAGLKQRRCELCGQGESWRGKRMGLILDHVNGIRDNNRLENLRIVCPNCAATLDTHCGKRGRDPLTHQECLRCGTSFMPGFRVNATARGIAAHDGTGTACPDPERARSRGRPANSSWPRSVNTAISGWDGDTASPTTPCGNGRGSTSASERSPRGGIQRQSRFRVARGRTGVGTKEAA